MFRVETALGYTQGWASRATAAAATDPEHTELNPPINCDTVGRRTSNQAFGSEMEREGQVMDADAAAVWPLVLWLVAFFVVLGGTLYFCLRSDSDRLDRILRWGALAGMVAVVALVAPSKIAGDDPAGTILLVTPVLFTLAPVLADYLSGGWPIVNALVGGLLAVAGLLWAIFISFLWLGAVWYFLPLLVLGMAALASIRPRSTSAA